MKFTDLIPSPDILLELEPGELAGYIIEYFNKAPDVQVNRSIFSSDYTVKDTYPPDRMKECQHALMEAWAVLEQEGLVAQRIDNPVREKLKKRLYSVKEAAIYLGRTVRAVREMLWAGKIPYIKDGRRILLDITDMNAWIDKSKIKINY